MERADGGGYMIELRNVSKIFKTKESEVKALDDVSLKIEDGDIYGIIGFSGAGKFTPGRLRENGQSILSGSSCCRSAGRDRDNARISSDNSG
jgi:hypothetical protein